MKISVLALPGAKIFVLTKTIDIINIITKISLSATWG